MAKKLLIWIFVSFLLASIVTAHSYTPVHYFQFEDDLTNDGSASDVLTGTSDGYVADGIIGKAIDFEATSSHIVSVTPAVDLDTISTIDTWVRVEAFATYLTAVCMGDTTSDNMIEIDTDGGTTDAYIRMRTSATTRWTDDTTVDITSGWHHIVVTRDPSDSDEWHTYIDGTLTADTGVTTALTTAFTTLYLGGRCDTSSHWDGEVDNVALFTEGYTSADVTWSYNSGSGRDLTGGGGGGGSTPTITETYTEDVAENSTENIKIIFDDYDLDGNTIINLVYNGTTYSPDKTIINGTRTEWDYDMSLDFIRFNNSVHNFYWNYSLNGTEAYVQTDSNSQTVGWPTNKPTFRVYAHDNYTYNPLSYYYVNITGDDYGIYTYNLSGEQVLAQKSDLSTTISVWSDTYVLENYSVTINSSNPLVNASLVEIGAVFLTIYNERFGNAITGIDVSMSIDGGTTSISDTTGAYNTYYTTIGEAGNLTISLSKTGEYSTRNYYEVMLPGRYVQLNAYLLNSSVASSKSFTVQNNFLQLVPDAQLSFYKTIGGNLVKVGQIQTDFSGVATIDLNSNSNYLLRVTADGYLQKEVSLIPSASSYIVKLGASSTYTNLFNSIDYNIQPGGDRGLDSNVSENFILSISSANNDLDYWGVQVSYSGSSYVQNLTDSTGGIGYVNITTPENYTEVDVIYFFKKADGTYWEKPVKYYVYPTNEFNYTAVSAFADANDEDGFNELEKVILAVFITLGLIGGTATLVSGFNPMILVIEILILLGGFAYFGWLPMWVFLLIAVPLLIIFFLTKGGEM